MNLIIKLTYLYVAVIQPLLVIFFWQFWYLRPLSLYIASAYLIPFLIAINFPITALIYIFGNVDLRDRIGQYTAVFQGWILRVFGQVMFGFEVVGSENIPDPPKGALIVYYHGLSSIDQLLMGAEIFLRKGLVMGGIVHHVVMNVPIINTYFKLWGCINNKKGLIESLKNGRVMTVAPGGAYEAMFSQNYSVEWRGHCGFAAVAKEADVPVIPMFTTNLREHQDMINLGPLRDLFVRSYLKYRSIFLISCSGLPVKLRSYFGEPLYCGEDESPEDFAARVKKAIEDLRDKHQRKPPSRVAALLERFGIEW